MNVWGGWPIGAASEAIWDFDTASKAAEPALPPTNVKQATGNRQQATGNAKCEAAIRPFHIAGCRLPISRFLPKGHLLQHAGSPQTR
jgi:hypothetical protein